MWQIYKYVMKHPLGQDIFQQTYRNVVFTVQRLYLDFSFIYCTVYTVQCTYASLNTVGIKFIKLIIV